MLIPFAAAVFSGAFLLFQVQPVIGKCILPWFGSTPGVWNTCMLFFQVLLLGGYAYAHGLNRWLAPRAQAVVHVALLGAAIFLLPVAPDSSWRPSDGDDPTGRILGALVTSVGVPYLLLSSTGPLLLSWFGQVCGGRTPYRLYALSNLGSLLALLSYPFVFEPRLLLEEQTLLWSVSFGVFVALCGGCAALVFLRARAAAQASPDAAPADEETPPRPLDLALWVGLAACGSGVLLATTNQLCLDVAVIPFLWVVPLSVYLITFILCFDSDRWYSRRWFGMALPFALMLVIWLLYEGVDGGLGLQIAGYTFAMFVLCMCCHGELAAARPSSRHLTLFFLMVSVGGAVGGLLVTLGAPALLDSFHELHLLCMASAVLFLLALVRARVVQGMDIRWAFASLIVLSSGFVWLMTRGHSNVVRQERNFYGVLAVREFAGGDDGGPSIGLRHGRISHGDQWVDEPSWPTTYYGPESGVGFAARLHPARTERGLRLGVIGLGAGTMAAYMNATVSTGEAPYVVPATDRGDFVRFYEINPKVVDWAREHFSYLSDASRRGAEVQVSPGDARLVMERQLREGFAQRFDVLVVDAFSGDAIPIHLLTAEAWTTYLGHLAPDGILAVHVSNRFIDLVPVVQRLASSHELETVLVDNTKDARLGVNTSSWVLVTANRAFLDRAEVRDAAEDAVEPGPLWTDDFSAVFPLLK